MICSSDKETKKEPYDNKAAIRLKVREWLLLYEVLQTEGIIISCVWAIEDILR